MSQREYSLKSMLIAALVVVATASMTTALAEAGKRVWNFDQDVVGKMPPGFTSALTGQGKIGQWAVVKDDSAPSPPNVLAQTSADPTDYRFPLAIADDTHYQDLALSVKFKTISGKVDQGAGLVFRLIDKDNYYIVRANADEDNYRLYHVVKGRRVQFAGANFKVTPNAWHEIMVEARGNQFKCFYDGKLKFTATDDTFKEAGKIGLWTKADSVIHFDDLTVEELSNTTKSTLSAEVCMKMPSLAFLVGVLALPVAIQAGEPLRLVQKIPLPSVEGRIDHMSADVQGQRLFVSALGNNTLEVLDLQAGKRLTRLTGLREPQGVFFVPKENKIFVANGDDGTCRVFDGSSYKLLATVNFSSEADNVRYDPSQEQIYVGYGEGALGILDVTTGQKVGDIPLRAHPESFQLEKSGSKIFANLPDANHTVAVVDRSKGSVTATWALGEQANFPMALDELDRRLFIVTRRPARLVVLDTDFGKPVADYPVVGDADDVFYDAAHKRVYVSGGEGFIDIFDQRDPDHYQLSSRIPTTRGARTSLFVPELNRLYLAVPKRENQGAEIRVYEAQP